jgi:hypothetical protein
MSANTSCEQCERLVPCRHGVIAGRELMCVQMPEHALSIRHRISKFLTEHGPAGLDTIVPGVGHDLLHVRQALSHLVSIGNVCKHGGGKGKIPATYWVTGPSDYGIKGQQASILIYLRQHGPATCREIRAGMSLERRPSCDLGRLADKGLVEIQPGTGRNAKYAATGVE